MRCKNCEYRLWALRARECPECGRSFRPSEYEFVPGSVRFACPDCDQSYYGTAVSGHLVPAEFNCVGCGRHVHMDEMVLFPTQGLEEEHTQPETMPWLERHRVGRIRAWFTMVGMAMVAPGRLMRLTPVQSSTGQAWWFAVITQLVFGLSGFLPLMILPVIAILGTGGGGPGAAGVTGVFLGLPLLLAITMFIMIAIWGLLTHGVLRITGGTAYGLGRTYQALCYSSGANALSGIPCLGLYLLIPGLAPVWWVISAVLMTREAQRVHGGRATLAVLIVPVILAGGLTLLTTITAQRALRFSRTVQSGTFVETVQQANTQMLTAGLLASAQNHGGRFPDHAIGLVLGNHVPVSRVFIWDAQTRQSGIKVGKVTLAEFDAGSLQLRRSASEEAAKGLPEGVTAHRLGDFVFTYHGIHPDSSNGKLWLVISSPTGTPSTGPPPSRVAVGLVDGTVVEFPLENWTAKLKEQNALRLQAGLPPLPDPSEVTHQMPAASQPVESAPATERLPESS